MMGRSEEGQASAERYSSRWNTTAPFAQNEYILFLLDKLSQLERSTRPSLGSESAKAKDSAAFDALELAGKLVAAVASWAINHEIGLAVEGLQFVPLQPAQTKNHSQYRALKAAVNDHRHEEVGGSERGNRTDPLFLRTCLFNLLRANSGAYPDWLRRTEIDALDALKYGETYPIFRKIARKKGLGLKERRLILKVIEAIYFRRTAYDISVEQALFDVSEAIDRSSDTIKSWERRFKKEAPLEVSKAIAFATNHGSWVADAIRKRHLGEEVNEERLERREARYGDLALKKIRKDLKATLTN
jgi:hypothetical protein